MAKQWAYPPPPLWLLAGGEEWAPDSPYARPSKVLGTVLVFPTGQPSDLTSIPAPVRPFIRSFGLHTPAALFHDLLTRRPDLFPDVTRKQADQVMAEFMKADGVGKWKRRAIYAGIRAGGWYAWREHRKAAA